MSNIEELARRIEADGVVTQAEVEQMDTAAMADGNLSASEKRLILAAARKCYEAEMEAAAPVERLAQKIEADGVITRAEIAELHEAIAEDGVTSSDETMILQSILAKLRMGTLREV